MNINKSFFSPKKLLNVLKPCSFHFFIFLSYIHQFYFLNFRFSVFSERKQSALLTQINGCNRGMVHSAVLWVKIECPTWENIMLVFQHKYIYKFHSQSWSLSPFIKGHGENLSESFHPPSHMHTHRLHRLFFPLYCKVRNPWKVCLPLSPYVYTCKASHIWTFSSVSKVFCISKSIQIY